MKERNNRIQKLVGTLILCCFVFLPMRYVQAMEWQTYMPCNEGTATAGTEDTIYLYLHSNYGNDKVNRFVLTNDNIDGSFFKPSFTRDGYKLVGYTYDSAGYRIIPQGPGSNYVYMLYTSSGGVKLHAMPTEDFHMYALWNAVTYNITYNSEGEVDNSVNPSTYTVEDCIELKTPAREGYYFAGWYMDEALTEPIATIEAGSTGDMVLYAKWQCAHVKTLLKNYQQPTCCYEGYSGDIYCSECLLQLGEGETIPATGDHNITITGRIDATCLEEGYTGEVYCTNSGYLVQEGQVIPAVGHNWDTGVVTVEPTEESTGVRVFTCLVCDAEREEELPVVVKACAHEQTQVRNGKIATCNTEGYSGDIYCMECGAFLQAGERIEKVANHNWSLFYERVSTTEEDGEKIYRCLICGNEKKETTPKKEKVNENPQTDVSNEEVQNNESKNVEKGVEEHTTTTVENTTNMDSASRDNTISITKKTKVTRIKICKDRRLKITLKKVKGYRYQIKIATSANFKKGVKRYNTSKNVCTTKQLKNGKTYYVKVRLYKVVGGKTFYGKWSNTRKVKLNV